MSVAMNMHRCPWIAMTGGESKRPQTIPLQVITASNRSNVVLSIAKEEATDMLFRNFLVAWRFMMIQVFEKVLWRFLGVLISTFCLKEKKKKKKFRPQSFSLIWELQVLSSSRYRYRVSSVCCHAWQYEHSKVISYTWQCKEVLFVIQFIFVIFRCPR